MDGPEGESHPFLGARIMHLFDWKPVIKYGVWIYMPRGRTRALLDKVFGERLAPVRASLDGRNFDRRAMGWWYWSLYHSRFLAKGHGEEYSSLCVAGKYAFVLEPWWFYLPRVILSGEIHEYMAKDMTKYTGELRVLTGRRVWHKSVAIFLDEWVKNHFKEQGEATAMEWVDRKMESLK